MHSSSNKFSLETALEVTKSNFSLFSLAKSSILECTVVIFFSSNSLITSFKNVILLFNASTSVISISSNTIFRTIPGNPAPVPASQTLIFLFKSYAFINVKLS